MLSKWLFCVVSAVGAAVLTALVMHLALRRWRCKKDAHWTERARMLWQARRAIVGAVLSSTGLALLAWMRLFPGEDGRWWLMGIVVGVLAGSYPSAREIEPRYRFGVWLEQTFWAGVVQFGMVVIFLGLMFTMPKEMEAGDWGRAAFGILTVALILTGVWVPLMEKLFGKEHPEWERLKRLVGEVTAVTGVKPKHVWLGVTPVANAAALVHVNGVVVTSRLMEILNDAELRAVLFHEMAHLRENLGVRLARLAGALCWMALVFFKPVLYQYGLLGVAGLMGGTLAVMRLSQNLARRLENRADEAAMIGAEDSADYARALEKLYEANQMPAVMRGRMVHPHLYDRMVAAGVTPDYPRPEPPGTMAWPGWAVLALPVAGYAALIVERMME
ncbi:MAG TPA: M56 family metallopeptidase [Prosthecobacter sp.]|nr:M56 family metallopeptidase [Prosthecobacter sp.]